MTNTDQRLADLRWKIWCIESKYDGPIPDEDKRQIEQWKDQIDALNMRAWVDNKSAGGENEGR